MTEWISDCGTVRLILGDCLEVLPTLEPDAVDAVVTDPPYGCNKAGWDAVFFSDWYAPAKRLERPIYTITGSSGIADSLKMVGPDFVDCISARNLNGMTRGPIGFGNWLACVVSNGKPKQGPNTFDFVVRGGMPNHPSPKPIEYMLKLIERVTAEGQVVIDPMMGSGTTGVACVRLGRGFIGVEKDPEHFKTAKGRIVDELKCRPLFDAPQNQLGLFGEVGQ